MDKKESSDSTKRKLDLIVGFGAGATKFFGDVQDASDRANTHWLGNRIAYDVHLGINPSNSFMVNLNVIYGRLSGNENGFKLHRNFDTKMVLAGVNAEYNFAGLYKKKLPIVNPFINVGAYYSNYFSIRSDFFDRNGTQYQYWSDGKIRDIPENAPNAGHATKLSRDYKYETLLVDKPVHSFTASAGLGLDLHLSRGFTVRFMSRYFHAFTDKVDGYYSSDFSAFRDGYLFNSISLVVNTMAFSKKRMTEEPNYKYLFDFSSVENNDEDNDGVRDMVDKCAATPPGVKVDADGCPLDTDGDGIADYRDKSPNTGPNVIVDQTGTPLDYELIAFYAVDTFGVMRVRWNKKYLNPRYEFEEAYTVNVKTVKTGAEPFENPVGVKIPELRQEIINDSLIVYRLGVYQYFEDADTKSKELHRSGVEGAYGVPEEFSVQVAEELALMGISHQDIKNRSYGLVEAVTVLKSTDAYASAQFKYNLSKVEAYLEQGVSEFVLVADFLETLKAFTWDEKVKEVHDQIGSIVDEHPVPSISNQIEIPIEEGETALSNEVVSPPMSDSGSDTSKLKRPSPDVQTSKGSKDIGKTASKSSNKDDSEFHVYDLTGKEGEKQKAGIYEKRKVTTAPVKPNFAKADFNGDGYLSSNEIEKILEEILEGRSDFMVSQFNEMVLYYTYFTGNADPIDFGGTQVAYVDGVLTILKVDNDDYTDEARHLLAKKYKEADLNGDGDLKPDEVQQMINRFMNGDKTYSAEKIYELIDLYFE